MTPDFRIFIASFTRIGLLSFGGPAAQIAVMHDELVTRRNWLSEQQFLSALSFCMMLPGPEAMQLATYAGWRLRGVTGGLIAGLLFVLPGAALMMALAYCYVIYGQVPVVEALFSGIKAAVVVIVLQALIRLSRKALTEPSAPWLAGLAFAAVFLFQVPFPAVVAAAALWGALQMRALPDRTAPALAVSFALSVKTVLIWGAVWAAPIALTAAIGAERLTQIGLFFSRLAVVTFGGAYAVLAYMTQEVVGAQGWLSTAQMMDGLGLAETTPGPLILVTQFVGFVAGAQAGGIIGGIWAGLITLWVTFVPCFLWIFAGAPYLERLSAAPRLAGALRGITAAVVGVIANLSLWFALHLMFADLSELSVGPVRIILPDVTSLQPVTLGLALVAGLMIFAARAGIPLTLAVCAALSFGISAI